MRKCGTSLLQQLWVLEYNGKSLFFQQCWTTFLTVSANLRTVENGTPVTSMFFLREHHKHRINVVSCFWICISYSHDLQYHNNSRGRPWLDRNLQKSTFLPSFYDAGEPRRRRRRSFTSMICLEIVSLL